MLFLLLVLLALSVQYYFATSCSY